MLGVPGRDPRINEQIAEEQHRLEEERVAEARVADQAHPRWWQRLIRKLKRDTTASEG